MEIKEIPIDKLNPAPYNPRKDLKPGDPEYERLKKSIQEFDLVEPIVWNQRTGNVVGGHQRLKVLRDLGEKKVAVSVVDLDAKKEKALNVALNKISGEWDFPKLKDLLVELDDGDFDLDLTGFSEEGLKGLMNYDPAAAEDIPFHDNLPGETITATIRGKSENFTGICIDEIRGICKKHGLIFEH